MISTRRRLILALLLVALAPAGARSAEVATSPASVADSAIAAAGMALELDRAADAQNWLAEVPAASRNWAWRLLAGEADRSTATLADIGRPIIAASVSRDGSHFAVAGASGEIHVLSIGDSTQDAILDTEGVSTRALALSPRGDHLLTASGDGRLRLWNLERKRLVIQWPGNSDELGSVAWSPDGKLLAAGGFVRDASSGLPKGVVTTYSLLGLEVRSYEPRAIVVRSLAFSPDGTLLAAGGAQGQLSLFDPAGLQAPRHLQVEESATIPTIEALDFSPDGARLAAACGDGSIRLWESASGRALPPLSTGSGAHRSAAHAVAFFSDGLHLASAGADLTLRIWDLRRAEPLAVLHGHRGALTGVAIARGDEILTAAEDGTVRRWSPAGNEAALDHAGATVWDARFDRDGTTLVTAAADGRVRLWDVAAATVRREIAAHGDDAVQALLAPDGERLATSGDDGTLRLWNARTGERTAELAHLDRGRFSTLAASPDGKLLAAGTSVGTVQLRSFATGELLRVLASHQGEVCGIAFSADGTRLVTAAADGNAIVWESASGNQVKSIHAHDEAINAVALSPDGRRLATASNDRTVRIWDLASGEQLAELRAHTERVLDVDWSPDGKLIASASNDLTARVWNAETGAPLVVVRAQLPVDLARWSPAGDALAVAALKGRVRVLRPRR